MIELKVKVLTIMLTELDTKETGLKINSLELELKLGQMELNILEPISTVRRKEKVNLSGMMEPHMMDNLLSITSKVKVFIFGQIKENSTDSG